MPVGILDISLYRDDLSMISEKPVHNATDIQFPVTGKDVILMDDVLYTGRTIRSALDALCSSGNCLAVIPYKGRFELVAWDNGHLTEAGSVLLAGRLPAGNRTERP